MFLFSLSRALVDVDVVFSRGFFFFFFVLFFFFFFFYSLYLCILIYLGMPVRLFGARLDFVLYINSCFGAVCGSYFQSWAYRCFVIES